MHGYTNNGMTNMVSLSDDLDPLAVALFKNGHDVWIANSRGTYCSLQHETLDWQTDEA